MSRQNLRSFQDFQEIKIFLRSCQDIQDVERWDVMQLIKILGKSGVLL